MNEQDDGLIEPFRRLLADICTPAAVRAAEAMPGVWREWGRLEQSGYLDALVPEAQGGADLQLADIFPLVVLTGEMALPAPFAETMVARALLAAGGAQAPEGAAIVLAPKSAIVPLASGADHALVSDDDRITLLRIDEVGGDPFNAKGGCLSNTADVVLSIDAGAADLTLAAAALTAAKMAGVMSRLLDISVQYAGERQQFGRSLGKFQAIQHQLAVMAQQVVSAHVAARIAMSGPTFETNRVAAAKCRASEASHQVAAIAHAVHGAIGVTEEYDLQLYTRRLKQWQLAFGSESYWAERLAAALLASGPADGVGFVRTKIHDLDPIA